MKKLWFIGACILSCTVFYARIPEQLLSADVKALSREHIKQIQTTVRASQQRIAWDEKVTTLSKIKEIVVPDNDRLNNFFHELVIHLQHLKKMNESQLDSVLRETADIMRNLYALIEKPKIAYTTRTTLKKLYDEVASTLKLIADELEKRELTHHAHLLTSIKKIKK